MTRRAAWAVFLLFAAVLLVVAPAEASLPRSAGVTQVDAVALASLERPALGLASPALEPSGFSLGEDLGVLDTAGAPGSLGLCGLETRRCALAYARNNPLRFVDPDGRQSAEAWVMYRERQEIEKHLGSEAVATYDRAFQQAGFTALTALSYVTPGPEEVLTTPLFLGAVRFSSTARVSLGISKMSTDWAVKGFHLTVDGVEVAMKAGPNGKVALSSVFSRDGGTKAFGAAARKVADALKDKKEVERMLREARRGEDYLRSQGKAMATEKADELKRLAEALEKLK